MRVDELEDAKQFGRNGDPAPALGAALQDPDLDRGGLEEAPDPPGCASNRSARALGV